MSITDNVGQRICHVQEEAARLIQEGRPAEAATKLLAMLTECQTADLWNDLATAAYISGDLVASERAYRQALILDTSNRQAAVNLSFVLLKQSRFAESLPIITPHLVSLTSDESAAMRGLVTR
jgi:Flp pilus assembly protein TadD